MEDKIQVDRYEQLKTLLLQYQAKTEKKLKQVRYKLEHNQSTLYFLGYMTQTLFYRVQRIQTSQKIKLLERKKY